MLLIENLVVHKKCKCTCPSAKNNNFNIIKYQLFSNKCLNYSSVVFFNITFKIEQP